MAYSRHFPLHLDQREGQGSNDEVFQKIDLQILDSWNVHKGTYMVF